MGEVQYIDFEKDQLRGRGTANSTFIHKRKSFEHEKEIRALIIRSPQNVFNSLAENGLSIYADLKILIEKIYVAPNSPIWFHELVRTIVGKYNFEVEIIRSDLEKDPMY